jgi:hypothetical protein
MQRRMITIAVAVLAVALTVVGLSIAQPPQGGGPGGPGGPGGRFDPTQMRQRMMDRMKDRLGADDEAWKVLEPRLAKVMELSRDVSGGGGGRAMFGGFGGMRGQRGGNNNAGPGGGRPQQDLSTMTPVEKATETLSATLENQSATPEEIAKQLKELRAAREKARQELATAQEELRKILTPRQEALLVLMGQLN